MTREISVTQARAELADLVSRVGYSGERILLTRHGRPLAALVPVADLETLERRPAEIGFSIPLPPDPETKPAKPAKRPESAPLRIAAQHRGHDRR
jgi:prevent-host-death family protein